MAAGGSNDISLKAKKARSSKVRKPDESKVTASQYFTWSLMSKIGPSTNRVGRH